MTPLALLLVLFPLCLPSLESNFGALPLGGSPLCFRSAAAVLRPVPALVPGVLPGADHGPPHPVPHRNVHALDPHGPYSGNQRTLHDGVRADGLWWVCAFTQACNLLLEKGRLVVSSLFDKEGKKQTVFLALLSHECALCE